MTAVQAHRESKEKINKRGDPDTGIMERRVMDVIKAYRFL